MLAAARLRVGGRRLRALARGDASALQAWLRDEGARALAEARRDAYADLAALERCGARIVALGDATYPAGLAGLRDAPAFLCVRGALPVGGVAVVGTRTPSPAALAWTTAFAGALDRPLVSGLALGVDAAAHRAALAAGNAQIAYVGTGIARTYPPAHAELAETIVAAGGALASERLPDDPVTRWSLVARDRLQAAHADAVVLVESEPDGGAMHTVAAARRLGRRVYALPLDADGNREALATGAEALSFDVPEALARVRRSMAPMETAFDPFDLDKAKRLTGDDLDALPFGVIVVDRHGTILEYNAYERNLAGMGQRTMLGLNFFRDVAPCTAIREFEGRFEQFLDSSETSIEPFTFVFPFARGPQRVSIVFVRTSMESDRATICVLRIADGA